MGLLVGWMMICEYLVTDKTPNILLPSFLLIGYNYR